MSEEILGTVEIPPDLSDDAWVRPESSLFPTWSATRDGGSVVRGLAVNASGGFFIGLCPDARSVSCCAAVP
jgi:hypothetical protein